jgi:hypothetical protein
MALPIVADHCRSAPRLFHLCDTRWAGFLTEQTATGGPSGGDSFRFFSCVAPRGGTNEYRWRQGRLGLPPRARERTPEGARWGRVGRGAHAPATCRSASTPARASLSETWL